MTPVGYGLHYWPSRAGPIDHSWASVGGRGDEHRHDTGSVTAHQGSGSGRQLGTVPIRLDPQFAGGYGNRGVAYERLGKYRRAIEDYDEAIRLDPKDAHTYSNRGVAYASLGEYQRAIEEEKRNR